MEYNFYPVDSYIMIEDEDKEVQMVVANSVSEAGSVYMGERIEMILNRRTKHDDNLGMAEALKEAFDF